MYSGEQYIRWLSAFVLRAAEAFFADSFRSHARL